MKVALSTVLPLALLLAGCASSSEKAASPPAADEQRASQSDEAKDSEKAAQELRLAQARLELKQMELDSLKAQHAARLEAAEKDLAIANERLSHFITAEMPHRLASERLSLQTSKDRAQEAADELKQIEIMYKEQDLDDMTAEFVVARGRRNAERAAARIELQEQELATLEGFQLPQEKQSRELAVKKATEELEALKREHAIALKGREIGLIEAQQKVAELEKKQGADA